MDYFGKNCILNKDGPHFHSLANFYAGMSVRWLHARSWGQFVLAPSHALLRRLHLSSNLKPLFMKRSNTSYYPFKIAALYIGICGLGIYLSTPLHASVLPPNSPSKLLGDIKDEALPESENDETVALVSDVKTHQSFSFFIRKYLLKEFPLFIVVK